MRKINTAFCVSRVGGGATRLELETGFQAVCLDTELGRIWEGKTQQTNPLHLTFVLQSSPSRTRLLSSYERAALRTRTRPFSWTKMIEFHPQEQISHSLWEGSGGAF